MNLRNVTPARARALEQLLRHGSVRTGVGMYDDEQPIVSPAGAQWLRDAGLATGPDDDLVPTEAALAQQ